jgi:hypothetical protein
VLRASNHFRVRKKFRTLYNRKFLFIWEDIHTLPERIGDSAQHSIRFPHPVFREVGRKQRDLKAEQEAQYHIKYDIKIFPNT